MKKLGRLFENNRRWAEGVRAQDAEFFAKLSRQQAPDYLWIGCADSRVPATEICGLRPGEMFVHRNVANLVVHSDFNCLSVLQYAVEVLQVEHVIVCGHYGCGGVRAAMESKPHGLIDNWLRHIKDVYDWHREELDAIADPDARADRLCELNVQSQILNLGATTIVQDAWRRGQPLTIHGWIYGLGDGQLKDLDLCISDDEALPAVYRMRSSSGV
ncbi:MAG: carbonate dehydratase [Planctomycetota bacterium]|nr:MAG: carbonate dehydratase [Planctomycetota bacterium]